MPTGPTTTVAVTLAPGQVTFSRTMIDHGVPMTMAVLAVLLAVAFGVLLGLVLAARRSQNVNVKTNSRTARTRAKAHT